MRIILFVSVLLTWIPTATSSAQSADCTDYHSWEWAQSVYDQQPSVRAGLDPDGDGLACDDLPQGGIVPAWWTESIPSDVIEARVIGITDGDTLDVLIDDVPDTVRLYRSDTPEVEGCGGVEATNFTRTALNYHLVDGARVWLQSDVTDRDRYDRKLAYVWFEKQGQPYMLNEVLMRSGWAQDVDYGDRLYADEFPPAVQFAERWGIGQWALCGGFDAGNVEGPGVGQCDPSYPTVCIPLIEVTGDLDCKQVEYQNFEVIPPDPHNFDGNYDGYGCEGQ